GLHAAKPHVVIVSRDGDYGLSYGQDFIINDGLRIEFKQRVSRKRTVELTSRLSTALKKLDVTVDPDDVAEENRILSEFTPLNEPPRVRLLPTSAVSTSSQAFVAEMVRKYFSDAKKEDDS